MGNYRFQSRLSPQMGLGFLLLVTAAAAIIFVVNLLFVLNGEKISGRVVAVHTDRSTVSGLGKSRLKYSYDVLTDNGTLHIPNDRVLFPHADGDEVRVVIGTDLMGAGEARLLEPLGMFGYPLLAALAGVLLLIKRYLRPWLKKGVGLANNP